MEKKQIIYRNNILTIASKNKTLLIKRINYNVILKRNMLHAGTKLCGNEKIIYQQMIFKFINYTKRGDFSMQSHIQFCESVLNMDFRLGQHLIETIFYKGNYEISLVRKELQKDFILSSQIETHKVDNAYIIASIHAKMLRQNTYFKKGILTVLEPPQVEKNLNLEAALKDTGQKFPDYVFEHVLGEIKIIRHYDLKTTKSDTFSFDKGHVLSMSNSVMFDCYVERLLNLQRKIYGKTYPEIGNVLDKILLSGDSWEIRNEKTHEFYLNILHKYPNIRPSLVFKHDLIYESQNIVVPKYIQTIMSYYNIADSRPISEEALAETLFKSGTSVTKNFMEGTQHNQNIKNMLKEMLTNWTNIND